MDYGYLELFKLIGSTNEKRFPGFVIKEDGIWIDSLSQIDMQYLTPDELVGMFLPFRAHDNSTPVLKMPCTGQELAGFMKETGFDAFLVENIDVTEETDEDLCILLKQESLLPHEIAGRLKCKFPDITAYRIGVLLPANPGTNIDAGSAKKQGQRLLKQWKESQ